MGKYKITIEEEVYHVTVENLDRYSGPTFEGAPAPKNVSSAPAYVPPAVSAAPAVKETAAKPLASAGTGIRIAAPMPGTVLKVGCAKDQKIRKGDVLFVLEAMKMENEIMAPADGAVVSVNVAEGTHVEADALLCVLR